MMINDNNSGQSENNQKLQFAIENTDEILESIEEFDPLFRMGTLMLHKGKAADAVPYLEKAHSIRPDDIDAGINLAGAYILTKKFRKAVSVLEPLSEQYPDHPMIWTNLGAAYLGNPVLANDKEQIKAIAAFEKALDNDPVAPSVAYNIGLIYRDRQENEKAIEWFEKALQHNSRDEHAASLLVKLQNDQEADQ
jgi:tetratricopeptide (TPR) repeat protein